MKFKAPADFARSGSDAGLPERAAERGLSTFFATRPSPCFWWPFMRRTRRPTSGAKFGGLVEPQIGSDKRGGGVPELSLWDADGTGLGIDHRLLAFDQALERLEAWTRARRKPSRYHCPP
jgi:hypothetical protein